MFFVFSSPFYSLVFLSWEVALVVVCKPEIRTANMDADQIHHVGH